ncbi:MAG: hypothetical protein ACOC8R_00155 [Desulfosalsimonas sp.]
MRPSEERNFGKKGFFDLSGRRSKLIYLAAAILVFLFMRMLDNTVHEFSHALAVFAVGGELAPDPFLITPFGGYTRWQEVPRVFLPFVNIAGTLGSIFVFALLFIPAYLFSTKIWVKWISYWGVTELVNILFYWTACPIVSVAGRFDPISFSRHLHIYPVWVVGAVAAVPFALAVYGVVRATATLRRSVLNDPDYFHVKCLLGFYAFYFFVSISKYLDWLVVEV